MSCQPGTLVGHELPSPPVPAARLGLAGELGLAASLGLGLTFLAAWCEGEAEGLAGGLAMPE